jgi:hypothetical protein
MTFLSKYKGLYAFSRPLIKFGYYLTFEFTFKPLKSENSAFPGDVCNGKKKVRAVIC